jgi:hypothetical protein
MRSTPAGIRASRACPGRPFYRSARISTGRRFPTRTGQCLWRLSFPVTAAGQPRNSTGFPSCGPSSGHRRINHYIRCIGRIKPPGAVFRERRWRACCKAIANCKLQTANCRSRGHFFLARPVTGLDGLLDLSSPGKNQVRQASSSPPCYNATRSNRLGHQIQGGRG